MSGFSHWLEPDFVSGYATRPAVLTLRVATTVDN